MLESKKGKFLILTCGFTFWILSFALTCFAEAQYAYDSKGKRNPFIPLVSSDGRLLQLDKEEVKGDLVVEGIIYDKQGRSFAIVNGEVVGIGDMLLDYQVLKILDNKVIFIKEGEVTESELKKEE